MITFNLKVVPIEATVKKGFWVYHDSNIMKVMFVNTQSNIVYLEGDFKIPYNVACKQVAKLIAIVDNNTFSIVHGDYEILITSLYVPLNMEHPVTGEVYETGMDMIAEGLDISYTGMYELVPKSVKPSDVVKLTDIKLIDKFTDGKKENRYGRIVKYDKVTRLFTIVMNYNDTEITCKRDSFNCIGGSNAIKMVRVSCPTCKRLLNEH